MAHIDVSDVLLDPEFMDKLSCERNQQTAADNGRASLTTKSICFNGVVTSFSGDLLERMAGGERLKGAITIHSRFPLTAGHGDYSADVVSWRGKRYTVTNVADYGHVGRGFVCATAELIPLSG